MGKPTIICVDDEQLVLASLRDSLHQALGNDYVVEIAESGEEALELITELLASATEIPLIISDQLMPGLKGDELLAEIHRHSPRTLKVMLTGQATPDAVGRAVNAANLYRYIPKPWSGLGLIEMVKSALEQYFQDQDVQEVNSVLQGLNEQLEQEVQLRTAALRQHISLEQLITEISTQFLNTNVLSIDEGIQEALAKFGNFFGVDRSYVFRVNPTRQEVCCSHEWCASGIQAYRNQLQGLPIIAMPWLFNQLAAGKTVLIPVVEDLPLAAAAERAEFQMEGIQSLICVPVMVQEQWVGFVGFDLVQRQQVWPEEVIHSLRMIGELFAGVIFRQQQELSLIEKEERFRGAFDNAGIGMAIIGLNNRFIQVNPKLCEMLGYTAQELEALTFLDVTHPEDVRIKYTQRQQLFRDAVNSYQLEKRYLTKQGDVIWALLNVALVRDHRHQPLYYVTQVQDISDRKRMELALQNREQEMREITDAIPGMVYRYHRHADGEQYLSFVSRGVEQIYEVSAEEACADVNGLFGQVLPEDLPDLYASILRSAETLEPWNFEHRICTASGRLKWLHGRSHPSQKPDGSVVWHGILTDVTEIKQAELELEETRRRLQSLTENMPGMLYTLAQEGDDFRFIYASAACEVMFGVTPEQVLADSSLLLQRIHPDDLSGYQERMRDSMLNCSRFSYEWRHMMPSGEVVWLLGNSTPHQQPDGSIHWHGLVLDVSDRKQTELALRDSETRNQMMLDAIPDLMIFMDANGRYISRFSSAYTLDLVSHISDQELVQKTAIDLLPPHIAQRHLDGIHTALETQSVQQFEQQFTLGDRVQYEEVRVIPYRKDRALLIIRDISDRKQAEFALQDSEAKTRAIIEALPDLLIRMRSDGLCLEVHCAPYFETIKPAAEMVGHNLQEILPSAAAAQQLAVAQQALKMAAMQHYEYPLEFGGKKLWREVRIVPLRQDEVLIVVRDLSERKATEEALRRSEATNRALLQAIPDILIQTNRQGERLNIFAHDVNALYNPDSITIGGNIRDTLPERVAEQRLQLVAQALDTGEVQSYEYTLEIRGELRYQEARIVPVVDDHALVIVRDVTEQKRFELELKQAKEAAEAANVAKSSFLANMSHELRTPLNAILGFAQVMERDGNLDPQNFTNLQTILRSGDHLLALINDVLDLSKIEAGRLTVDIQPIDLPHLVDAVYGLLYQRAIAKGITLTVEMAPDLPPFVLTDGGKVRQILVNLVGNAIKFTDQGRVTLRVTRQAMVNNPEAIGVSAAMGVSTPIAFAVEDTGIGIDPADQERIFEAFEQTQAGTMNPDGTGLGLTITQRFVELLQGRIMLTSAPHVGSTFCVVLPMMATELAPVEMFESNQRVVRLTPGQPPVKVLVADDHEANRLFLVQLLALVGFEAVQATTGAEAIAQWRAEHPDVILMDLQMPEVDGFAATRQIREQELENHTYTPIIAITASVFPQDRNKALEAGCDQFLSKPCPEQELFQKLADVLGLMYEYETTAPDIATPPPKTLTVEDLEVMPGDWIEALYQAAILCYDTQVNQLIVQIPPEQANLQKILQYHNDNFDMEPIIEATQQYLNP